MLNKLMVHNAVLFSILCFTPAHAQQKPADAADEVRAAETAFAKSMADRNLTAFTALLANETVFFGNKGVLRGKAAVAALLLGACRSGSAAVGDTGVHQRTSL